MNPKISPIMILGITALVGVAPATLAQEVQSALPQEILACAGESDVMKRLSCYDREVAAFRNRPVSAPTPAPPVAAASSVPSPVAASVPTAVASSVPTAVASSIPTAVAADVPNTVAATTTAESPAVVAAEREPAAIATAAARATNSIDNFGFDAPMDEMTSNVARIRERPYGELIIYLENGQIWEQKHLDRRFRLKTGESVTISKGAVAGYRLSGNSNRSIQVERLK